MAWIVRVARRGWVLLVIAAVATVGGIVIYRFQGVFGSQSLTAGQNRTDNIISTIPKYVTYEVDGPADTSGMISYVDERSQPQQEHFDSLPWSKTLTTTVPSVFANLVAQGDSPALRCKITVNGQVRDQQAADGADATAFCLVKAA
jgi:type II secretory pathway pseudopilin PulG